MERVAERPIRPTVHPFGRQATGARPAEGAGTAERECAQHAGAHSRRSGNPDGPPAAYPIVRIRRGLSIVSRSISACDTPRSRSLGRNVVCRYV